jgi:hypothetical protein
MARKRRDSPIARFDMLQSSIGKNPQSTTITEYFGDLNSDCLQHLEQFEKISLVSKVSDKTYFAFADKAHHRISRAVNSTLYAEQNLVDVFLNGVKTNLLTATFSPEQITSACYTLVMNLACLVDLTNPGDKQTPGTFFQYLVTHLLSRHFGIAPSQRIRVTIGQKEDQQQQIALTMDLIMELGLDQPKYHIAIKNSTRERASEVWAHQRILEQAHPEHAFIGMLIGLAETKVESKTLTVTEICVPDQWRAYQQYIARISTIYYLDPPKVYTDLITKPPYINVQSFGRFFFDVRSGRSS